MNKEEPYREQAERLKQRIEKIENPVEDFLSLPPREQVHNNKRKKTKLKIKFPIIRLLVLFFILLPIIIFSVTSYLQGKQSHEAVKTTGSTAGYETINLKKSTEDEQTQGSDSDESNLVESNTQTTAETDKLPELRDEDSTLATATDPKVDGPETAKKTAPAQSNVQKETIHPQVKTRIVYHTVQPQETLFSLAMEYFHSQTGMEIIKNANGLTSEQINAGQVLKIPLTN